MTICTPEEERALVAKWVEEIGGANLGFGGPGLKTWMKDEYDISMSSDTALNYVRRNIQRGGLSISVADINSTLESMPLLQNALKDRWREVSSFFVYDSRSVPELEVFKRVSEAFVPTVMNTNIVAEEKLQSVGLGSGQTIHELVEAIKGHGISTKMSDARIFSLTGSIFNPEADSTEQTVLGHGDVFDADLIAQSLANEIRNKKRPKLIRKGIVRNLRASADRLNWLDEALAVYDDQISKIIKGSVAPADLEMAIRASLPDLAFVSVGVFAGHHKLFKFAKGRLKEDSMRHMATLDELKADLEELTRIVDAVREKTSAKALGFNCVADCCNRLFVLDAPQAYEQDFTVDLLLQQAKLLIDQKINPRLNTITKTLLRQVPSVLIATGANKSHAVRTILSRKIFQFKAVCLDAKLGERILQESSG